MDVTDCQSKNKKKKKATLTGTLLHATTATNFQWLLNNQRFRSSITPKQERALPSGTTRNESYHSRLNAHFRSTIQIAAETLSAELKAWTAADIAVSLAMLREKWSRKTSRANILPGVVREVQLFTPDSWLAFARRARSHRECHDRGSAESAKRRRKGTDEQVEIYNIIKAKTCKRRKATLFDA